MLAVLHPIEFAPLNSKLFDNFSSSPSPSQGKEREVNFFGVTLFHYAHNVVGFFAG